MNASDSCRSFSSVPSRSQANNRIIDLPPSTHVSLWLLPLKRYSSSHAGCVYYTMFFDRPQRPVLRQMEKETVLYRRSTPASVPSPRFFPLYRIQTASDRKSVV